MGAVTPETCRVVLQWINICILLHLLDFYSQWITMHGTTSLKQLLSLNVHSSKINISIHDCVCECWSSIPPHRGWPHRQLHWFTGTVMSDATNTKHNIVPEQSLSNINSKVLFFNALHSFILQQRKTYGCLCRVSVPSTTSEPLT